MPNICYYISGHGYGHGTRASQLISALLASDTAISITVCTKAPRHLFPYSDRLTFRAIEVDSSIVQPLPYEIDVDNTFKDLQRFLGADDGRQWIETELAFLHEGGFDLILADAPWIVGRLESDGYKLPKKVIVSNFTFDLVFKDLINQLPATSSAGAVTKYKSCVSLLIESYNSFDYLIRLPGAIDFPFLERPDNATKVLDGPLIYRPPALTRAATLEKLGIPIALHNHKILLVQFGGFAVTASSAPPTLPEGWICLTATPLSSPLFFTFPGDFYLPDLVAASDVILGKIGYGTVSECVGMSKPLIYVRREMFAEEPYLLRYMSQEGTCLELDKTLFERGDWRKAIEMVIQDDERRREAGIHLGCRDKSDEVAQMIREIIIETR